MAALLASSPFLLSEIRPTLNNVRNLFVNRCDFLRVFLSSVAIPPFFFSSSFIFCYRYVCSGPKIVRLTTLPSLSSLTFLIIMEFGFNNASSDAWLILSVSASFFTRIDRTRFYRFSIFFSVYTVESSFVWSSLTEVSLIVGVPKLRFWLFFIMV